MKNTCHNLKRKALLLTLSMLTISVSSYSQECDLDTLRAGGGVLIPKTFDKEQAKTKSFEYHKCSNLANENTLKVYYNLLSAQYLYVYDPIELDNVEDRLQAAFTIDSVLTCKVIMDMVSGYDSPTFPHEIFHKYFYSDFNNQLKCPDVEKSEEIKPINNEELNKLILEIEFLDQEFRGMFKNGSQQEENDQLNRRAIDSLFTIYEFQIVQLNRIYRDIVNHSTDCRWNHKWVERLINENLDDDKGVPLSAIVFRFYNSNDGYCTMKEPEKTKEFLEKLKSKVSIERQKQLRLE